MRLNALRPPAVGSVQCHEFGTARATRYLLVMVAVVSAGTLLLAAEALSTHRSTGVVVVAGLLVILAPALWICTWLVLRARRRAFAAYSASQHRLRAFVGSATEILWETTVDGIITYAGPRSEGLLGFTPQEIVDQGIDIVLSGRDQQRAQDLLATSLAGRHGWTNERFTFLTRDGREREMYSSALIHIDIDGDPVGFTGTLRDVEPASEADQEYLRSRSSVNYVLHTNALRTVFQPIVSLATGGVIGAEALSRFPADPQLTPDVWFQRAHDVGLGVELEMLALRTALSSATDLPQHIYVSVNLSPQTLMADELVDTVRRSAWPASQLVVEVTEHVSVSDYTGLLDRVEQLRRLGVRIAVDDAGAGYASFRHILELRPDYIKLDRRLVDGLDHDPAKRALAGAFVTFGREVDATIIAEGVETGLEVRAARALGMHAAQGYHLARPAAADRMWGSTVGG